MPNLKRTQCMVRLGDNEIEHVRQVQERWGLPSFNAAVRRIIQEDITRAKDVRTQEQAHVTTDRSADPIVW
jgi:hypothetical protein